MLVPSLGIKWREIAVDFRISTLMKSFHELCNHLNDAGRRSINFIQKTLIAFVVAALTSFNVTVTNETHRY